MGKPRLSLFWEAIRGFLPLALVGMAKEMRSAPWLRPGFVRRNRAALCGYPSRLKLFGPLPSFQDNIWKLDVERRAQAYFDLWPDLPREVRYCYLDRTFLEFMLAIPREEIVRVGQRRSLMKRSLVGIVPDKLLNRRRKASVQQEATKGILAECPSLVEMGHMVSSSRGFVDTNRLLEALQKARRNEEVPTESLMRAWILESWLRQLEIQGVLTVTSMPAKSPGYSSLKTKELPPPVQHKSSAS